MTLDFHVDRRELRLGSQDPITGWYAKSYVETLGYDKVSIQQKGFTPFSLAAGSYNKYTTAAYSCAPLVEGDEIFQNNKYYEVVSVEDQDMANSHMWYVCELHEIQSHWDIPSYGTGAAVDDPRKRTKVWLDTYITAANLKENDGTTNATYITCWDNPPYPLKKVFDTKGVDLIFSVGKGTSEPVAGADHYVYGYVEKPTVTVSALDKTGVSGDNLMWQGERELRRINETYPLGSLRSMSTSREKTQVLGSVKLYSVECGFEYARDKT